MFKEPLGIALIIALGILAIVLVPAGSVSFSVTPKGSVREDSPKAVVTPQVQQQAPEASAG